MTVVSETASSIPVPTDGSANVWPFPFRVDRKEDIALVLIASDGAEETVDPTAYDVTGLKLEGQGAVTYPRTGALPAGVSVRVDLSPPFTQPIDLKNQGRYAPEVVERGLDHGVQLSLNLQERLRRLRDRVSALALIVGEEVPPSEPGLDVPFITSAYLGLAGNGITDDGPKIQAEIDRLTGLGLTAFFFLDAPGGVSIRIDGKLRIKGGHTVAFTAPVLLGKNGCIAIHGAHAAETGSDDLRLLESAGIGDSFILVATSSQGGGPLSDRFGVGDRVTLIGAKDSCGNPLVWESHRITGIDDGLKRLDLADPLESAFLTSHVGSAYDAVAGSDPTIVQKQLNAHLAVGTTGPAINFTIAETDLGALAIGDWVLAEDDKRASDVLGASTQRIHRCLAQVRNVVGASVTLDRFVEHGLELAHDARLTVIDVASGIISGVSVEFAEAPDLDGDPVPSIEMAYAVSSAIFDAFVLNQGPFGSPGEALRTKLSADCWFIDGEVAYPKYLGSGQGYGWIGEWCADSGVRGTVFRGCRHSVSFAGATRSTAEAIRSFDDRVTAIDFHGYEERVCAALNPEIVGGVNAWGATRSAIGFGNAFHLAGSFDCFVRGGSVRHYRSTQHTAYGVTWDCGVDGCIVDGTRFFDVQRLAQIFENPSHPDVLIARRCGLRNIDLNLCSELVLTLEGNHSTSPTGYPIETFEVDGLRVRNAARLIRAERVSGLRLRRLDLSVVTPNPDDAYALEAIDVPSLELSDSSIRGTLRGVQLTDCTLEGSETRHPPRVWNVDFHDLTHGEVLSERGGNNGLRWVDNRYHGFTPTIGGTRASRTLFDPRIFYHQDVADDEVHEIECPQPEGIVSVWTTSGDFIQAIFTTGVGGVVTKVDAGTDSEAVGLDAVTCTDGMLGLGPRTNGALTIINRQGGTRGFYWSFG
jgi:hypothetical protein